MRLFFLFSFLVLSFGSFFTRDSLKLHQLSSLTPLPSGNFIGFKVILPTDDFPSSFQSLVFDAQGNKIKATQTILENFTYLADISNSRLTPTANVFLKVWAAKRTPSESAKYFGMIFDSEGSNVTSVFEVASMCGNEARASRSYYTNIGGGSFVFVWTSHCGTGSELVAQLISVNGTRIFYPFVVTAALDEDFAVCFSDLTPLAEGGFVVLYEARFALNRDSIIYAQKFSDKGEREGSSAEVIRSSGAAIPCAMGPFNSRGNILGVVGLRNNKFLVFSITDGRIMVSAFDSATMKKTKSFAVDSAPKTWSYDSLFYAPLDDQSVVITGCCSDKESYTDLWLVRVNETNLIELSELDLEMEQPFFYFTSFKTNTVILMHGKIDGQTGTDEVGLLIDFPDMVPSERYGGKSFLGSQNNQTEVGVAIGLGVVLFIALVFCLVRRYGIRQAVKNQHMFAETVASNEVISSEEQIGIKQ